MTISHPRNNFALQEDAGHSVLIAGGIGITPILSMIRRLEALGRSWELFYAARTRLAAAFLDELDALRPGIHSNLHVTFDQEPRGSHDRSGCHRRGSTSRRASLLLRPGADARGVRGGHGRPAGRSGACRIFQGRGKAGRRGRLRSEARAKQTNDRGPAGPDDPRCAAGCGNIGKLRLRRRASAAPARRASSKEFRTIAICFSARRSSRPTRPSWSAARARSRRRWCWTSEQYKQ